MPTLRDSQSADRGPSPPPFSPPADPPIPTVPAETARDRFFADPSLRRRLCSFLRVVNPGVALRINSTWFQEEVSTIYREICAGHGPGQLGDIRTRPKVSRVPPSIRMPCCSIVCQGDFQVGIQSKSVIDIDQKRREIYLSAVRTFQIGKSNLILGDDAYAIGRASRCKGRPYKIVTSHHAGLIHQWLLLERRTLVGLSRWLSRSCSYIETKHYLLCLAYRSFAGNIHPPQASVAIRYDRNHDWLGDQAPQMRTRTGTIDLTFELDAFDPVDYDQVDALVIPEGFAFTAQATMLVTHTRGVHATATTLITENDDDAFDTACSRGRNIYHGTPRAMDRFYQTTWPSHRITSFIYRVTAPSTSELADVLRHLYPATEPTRIR